MAQLFTITRLDGSDFAEVRVAGRLICTLRGHPADVDAVEADVRAALASEGHRWRIEARLAAPGGPCEAPGVEDVREHAAPKKKARARRGAAGGAE